MTSKTNLFIIYAALAVLAAFTCYQTLGQNRSRRMAYIKSEDVFKKFNMTKELEAKFRNVESERKRMIDSLEFDLTRSINALKADQKNTEKLQAAEGKRRYFVQKKQEFEEDNNRITSNYNGSIWERINQYVAEYAKDKGYDYVWGANGDGSLMYASEGDDVTEDLVNYVNEKYSGK